MTTRTNIVLDDELIALAMARARVKTKKAAVEAALKAYVRKPDYSGLIALRGTGVIADDYDPKTLAQGVGRVAESVAPYTANQKPAIKKKRPAVKRAK